MSESVKRITIDALPSSSSVCDEDIFIKSNQVETSKITAKAITEYVKENLDIAGNTQSNWNETDTSSAAYIKNKPTTMIANGGNADTVNNHTVKSDVPANAKFTDTVYTHPNSGVVAGTYKSVTVDTQGHVTGGSNPTTLDGYGITDAATKVQGEKADTAVQSVRIGTTEYKSGTIAVLPDYPTSLPASDVYDWAKAVSKPVYTASEVGADESGAANTAYKNAKIYTDDRIAQLIGTSPENLDTIEELGSAISENQAAIDAIENAITNKADVGHNHDELYATKSSEHTHENKTVLNTITQTMLDDWNIAKNHADSSHASSDAEKNIIVEIQKNGTSLLPDNSRTVNIVVPTKVSELNQDTDFILTNQQELEFTNSVATISDERITANSLADVYFTSDTIDIAEDADISVETIDGSVVLTASTEPTGAIKATIRIRVV